MQYHVLIATHHKMGTNWMGGVFRMIADELGVPYHNVSEAGDIRAREELVNSFGNPENGPVILFQAYGRQPGIKRAMRRWFRGLHVVRDPRDVLLSASKYHTWSDEAWLHTADEALGGATYQEAINALPSEEERMRFEMENHTGKVLDSVRRFKANGMYFNMRYEDMRKDTDLLLWHRICLRLGFGGAELPACFKAFVEHSIQFGKLKKSAHIQDRRVSRWMADFPRALLPQFDDVYGDVLDRFGYARSAEISEAEPTAG